MNPRPLQLLLGSLAFAGLSGCLQEHNGTAVGNPGNMDVTLRAVPEEVEVRRAQLGVARVVLEGCDGATFESVEVGRDLDALSGEDDPIELPGGEWCRTTLVLAEVEEGATFVVEGDGDNGAFTIYVVDQPTIVLRDRFVVDGNNFLLGIPVDVLLEDVWKGVDNDSGSDTGSEGSGGEEPADAPDFLDDNVELWLDADVDGVLSEDEDAVSVGDGFEDAEGAPVDEVDPDGQACGCQSGGGAVTWTWLLLLALGLGRRRR